MEEKREPFEAVLTVIGVLAAVLLAAEWTFFYLLTSGIINITQ
jgi:hypothetical protein